jgi:hypothetical protein
MTHHEHPNITVVREGFEAMQRGDTAWMDRHLADDVVWHVGGNSKWAGAYQGKAKVLEFFARQAQSTDAPPSVVGAPFTSTRTRTSCAPPAAAPPPAPSRTATGAGGRW